MSSNQHGFCPHLACSFEDVELHDISLEDYIAVKPKAAVYVPHTAGRYQKKRFRKAQCPIVERCASRLLADDAGEGAGSLELQACQAQPEEDKWHCVREMRTAKRQSHYALSSAARLGMPPGSCLHGLLGERYPLVPVPWGCSCSGWHVWSKLSPSKDVLADSGACAHCSQAGLLPHDARPQQWQETHGGECAPRRSSRCQVSC